jgi:hypothetical protein
MTAALASRYSFFSAYLRWDHYYGSYLF